MLCVASAQTGSPPQSLLSQSKFTLPVYCVSASGAAQFSGKIINTKKKSLLFFFWIQGFCVHRPKMSHSCKHVPHSHKLPFPECVRGGEESKYKPVTDSSYSPNPHPLPPLQINLLNNFQSDFSLNKMPHISSTYLMFMCNTV